MSNSIQDSLSKKLLSKTYWELGELQNSLSITESQLNHYLEILYTKFLEIGISLEVIQLHSKDYVVIYIESESPGLTNLQLGLLTVFGIQTKLKGGFLSEKDMIPYLTNYFSEIKTLETEKYIEKTKTNSWSLTPLGVVVIFPHINDAISLVQKLL